MTPRYTAWCEKHPEKARALQKVVADRLGMRFGIKSELGQRAVDDWCVGVLSALLGWTSAPDAGTPPETRPAQLTDVTEILDLEKR